MPATLSQSTTISRQSPYLLFSVSLIFLFASLIVAALSLQRLGNERDVLRNVVVKVESSLDRTGRASREAVVLRESSSLIKKLHSFFITTTNIVPFVETIETLASRLRVQLAISSVNLSEGNKVLVSRLSLHGNFAELHKTLAVLELLPYKLSISDVTFSYNGGNNDTAFQSGSSVSAVAPAWSGSVTLTVNSIINEQH